MGSVARVSTPPPEPQMAGDAGADDARSLWIGGLLPWMDEDYLYSCFSRSPELSSLSIKGKPKQAGDGGDAYGFLHFTDHAAADQILRSYNGQDMPNAPRRARFHLRWATTSVPDGHALYAGGLAYDVTDYMLLHVFKIRYPSVRDAKVIWDRATNRSKGYGFVLFGDAHEYRQALSEMNGAMCSSRPMRVGPAPSKRVFVNGNRETADSGCDPHSSRLFVGGLEPCVTEVDLKEAFSPYGEVVNARLIVGKSCGFITYSTRTSAEEAIRMLNGSHLGGGTLKVVWGRRPSDKRDRWNDGYSG